MSNKPHFLRNNKVGGLSTKGIKVGVNLQGKGHKERTSLKRLQAQQVVYKKLLAKYGDITLEEALKLEQDEQRH